jgi:uncharacterized SAM-binding protein YcdF (DUF218 family)
MKRWKVIATTGALGIGGILLFVLNVGHWLSSPRSVPAHGDLIVALGGGGIERLQIALTLYEQGHAQRILLTGIERDQGPNGNRYQHWRSQYLLKRGVPLDALLFDHESANSYEEANRTAELMRGKSWKTSLVISDPPHLRRLHMVWRPACARHDLECRLITTEPPTWNPSRWWREKTWAKFVGMELVKLAYYTVVYEIPDLIHLMG